MRRTLGALLLILVAVPLPALCSICTPDHCMAMMAQAAPPRDDGPTEAGCHSMSHEPAPPVTVTAGAMTADCCAVAAAAQAPAPAVPSDTTGTVAMVADALGTGTPLAASRPRPERGREASPPAAPPPLYTLHSSLLI